MQSRPDSFVTLIHPIEAKNAFKIISELLTNGLKNSEAPAHINITKEPAVIATRWLLRDSDKGIGFVTLVAKQKTIDENGIHIINRLIRFYFDYDFETGKAKWSTNCNKEKALAIKLTLFNEIKKDKEKFDAYLSRQSSADSMTALFQLIEKNLKYSFDDNIPYQFAIDAEAYHDPKTAVLSQQLGAHVAEYRLQKEVTETHPSDVPGSLFHQPAAEAPARSRTPDANPPKQSYSK